MSIHLECKKKEVSAFVRKKSFSVDLQDSSRGVWNSLRNKAEQFFGLNDSYREDDAENSDVWNDFSDDELENISIFVHDVMEPPPRDCYCVAIYT